VLDTVPVLLPITHVRLVVKEIGLVAAVIGRGRSRAAFPAAGASRLTAAAAGRPPSAALLLLLLHQSFVDYLIDRIDVICSGFGVRFGAAPRLGGTTRATSVRVLVPATRIWAAAVAVHSPFRRRAGPETRMRSPRVMRWMSYTGDVIFSQLLVACGNHIGGFLVYVNATCFKFIFIVYLFDKNIVSVFKMRIPTYVYIIICIIYMDTSSGKLL